jgi:hypothetical protein
MYTTSVVPTSSHHRLIQSYAFGLGGAVSASPMQCHDCAGGQLSKSPARLKRHENAQRHRTTLSR